MLKINAPTATAPKYSGPGRRPTTAMSTAPSSGTDTLDIMIGQARRQVRRFQDCVMAGSGFGVQSLQTPDHAMGAKS